MIRTDGVAEAAPSVLSFVIPPDRRCAVRYRGDCPHSCRLQRWTCFCGEGMMSSGNRKNRVSDVFHGETGGCHLPFHDSGLQ